MKLPILTALFLSLLLYQSSPATNIDRHRRISGKPLLRQPCHTSTALTSKLGVVSAPVDS